MTRKAKPPDPREEQALNLRRSGASYEAIGSSLGCSPLVATRLVRRALSRRQVDWDTEEARQLEAERVDRALLAIWGRVLSGDLTAIDRFLRLHDLRPKGNLNRVSAEETIAELRRAGRLEGVDEAKIQAVRSLANQVDADPSNAQMWRTYLEAIGALTEDGTKDPDALDRLVSEINSRTPVGNPPEA
jgi:hypothetical protein